jgi:DNA ligase (NAD+)
MASALPDISYLANCDYDTFVTTVNSLSPELRKELTKVLKDNYFNSKDPVLISDDRYDYIAEDEQLVERGDGCGPGGGIGAPVSKENEVKLPTHLGSLIKVKEEKELRKFLTGGERYTVSEKLDGMSCLYYRGDLYTRGDGDFGSRITTLLRFIKLPSISDDIMVRGELVVSKEKFEKYKDDFATPRSFMSGVVNADDPPERAKEIEFVAHELISEPPMPITEQFKFLHKLGFTVVKHATIKSLNVKILDKALDMLKSVSRFGLDGVVIQDSDDIYQRPSSGNPKYVFAFKKNTFSRTTVKRVIWNVSKRGQIKPTIEVEPIILQGETVSQSTGKNAKFIVNNNIGPGAIVSITLSGGVIPFIDRVIKGTTPQMPDIPYSWNETGVDLMVDDSFSGDEVKVSIMENFFKELEIKYLGDKTIRKLYTGGLLSAIDIIHATELQLASIIGDGNAKRVKKQIDRVFNGEVDQVALMSASGCFGIGLGIKKIKLILDEVPDLLERKDFSDIEVKGIAEKTMSKIVEGIPKFKKFLEELNSKTGSPCIIRQKESNHTGPLSGKSFVLTGFRDLEPIIKEKGGIVSDKVSQLTTAVVCKDTSSGTRKIKEAEKLGIRILTKDEFLEEFM